MRWVAAVLIALAMVLPFARYSSGGESWIAFDGSGYFEPFLALFFIWPLIAAYSGTFFPWRLATWIRVVAEPPLLVVTAFVWSSCFVFARPAVGACLSGLGIVLYFTTWAAEVGRGTRSLLRRFR
jgi:hypothetical protein